MAPRIKVTAILSCDPSWRGLGFILNVPSMEFNKEFLFDMQDYDKSKKYKHPLRTTVTIQKILDEMFEKEPKLILVDKVIMESQHKPNMQVLSWLISASLLSRLGNISIEYVSPLAWKAHFGIELTGSHGGNKAAAVDFVENNKNRLVASETVTDHNTADACLLLNSYLETTKNIIYKTLEDWSSMSEVEVGVTKLICPKCKKASGVVRKCEDAAKKNYGKHFLTCWWTNNRGQPDEKKCGNFKALYANVPKIVNGFVDKTWKVYTGEDDEVVEVAKPTTGVKRSADTQPSHAPPAKKIAAAPAPVPVPGPGMSLSVAQFNSTIKKAIEHLKDHIDNRMTTVLENLVAIDSKTEMWTGEVNIIRQLLERIVPSDPQPNQETAEESQEEEESQLPTSGVPPLPLEAGELDEISF